MSTNANSLRTKNIIIAIFIVTIFSFSGCMEDVYDPNYRTPIPDEMKDLKISADFNWSTTKNIKLNVNVNDQYEGKYYYEVAVYDSNPFFDDNAQLLAKGLAKRNEDFSTTLTIPQDIEQLFIVQSMKMKNGKTRNAIKNIKTDESMIICDFSNSDYSNDSDDANISNIQKRSNDKDDFEVPSNAIPIKGNGEYFIEANKNYVIKEGDIFNGILKWGWCQNTNIYIMGHLLPQNNQEINGNCKVYIGENGTYQCPSILINNNSAIINKGNINIEKIEIDNPGSFISNYNQLISNSFILTSNSRFYNYCFTDIKEILDIQGNRDIFVGQEGLLRCKKLKMNNSTVKLNYNAIMEVTNEASFISQNIIQANETDKYSPLAALLKLNTIKVDWGGVNLNNQLQILLKTYNSLYDDPNYVKKGNKVITVYSTEETFKIPASGCNGEGNNINTPEEEPDGSNFPIIVSPDNSYTFIMEDNWPVYGDYDMNDLVMDIQLEYELEKNGYIEELEIKAILRAVGASKRLSAGIQLDKVPVANINKVDFEDEDNQVLDGTVFDCVNGTEKEQEYTVIPFFDNAHKVLGAENGKILNTGRNENDILKSKEIEIKIEFKKNTVRQEDINIDNLNFFIVTDGKRHGRKEIHLKGFEPTQKASRILLNSNCDAYNIAPYLSKDNLIWGLMIPSSKNNQFKYPKENKNIKEAYPMFENWVKSSGTQNKNWYKEENAIKENIYNIE